jgi:hypothetical protein
MSIAIGSPCFKKPASPIALLQPVGVLLMVSKKKKKKKKKNASAGAVA